MIVSINLPKNTDYTNFYQNIISFSYGDEQREEIGITDSWKSRGNDLTIGDYMASQLTESGAWEKANTFFNTLLKEGMTEHEATWVAFNMAFNVDGILAGNDYQNTMWAWHNTIKLDQVDGELNLRKVEGTEAGVQKWERVPEAEETKAE